MKGVLCFFRNMLAMTDSFFSRCAFCDAWLSVARRRRHYPKVTITLSQKNLSDLIHVFLIIEKLLIIYFIHTSWSLFLLIFTLADYFSSLIFGEFYFHTFIYTWASFANIYFADYIFVRSLVIILIYTHSFWGINIPARIYPWALLLILQLLMPAVSLLVHASGLLAGYACKRVVVRVCMFVCLSV